MSRNEEANRSLSQNDILDVSIKTSAEAKGKGRQSLLAWPETHEGNLWASEQTEQHLTLPGSTHCTVLPPARQNGFWAGFYASPESIHMTTHLVTPHAGV